MTTRFLKKVQLTLFIFISPYILMGCSSSSTGVSIGEKVSSGKVLTILDTTISTYEQNLKTSPKEIPLYIGLSELYLQKIRETADISYYEKIDTLLNTADNIDPNNANVSALKAQVYLGRHDFKKGNIEIQKALSINPNRAQYYGVLGDSEIELGNYTGAVDAFQKMVDMRPDYSSYIRIAYIRELYEDIEGAKKSLKLALDAGSTFKENMAFAYVELGKLEMRKSLSNGKKNFDTALEIDPNYPPALEGLGKVAYFEGDLLKARSYFEKAYNTLPIAQYLIDLADLHIAENQTKESRQKLTLAELTFEGSSKAGINIDLEESLFLSDHDLNLENALKKAEQAYAVRPSIYGADTLAWALYKNNHFSEALAYRDKALSLGGNDALILYHQGMIALKNQDTISAKNFLSQALEINPHFSLLGSIEAKNILNSLN